MKHILFLLLICSTVLTATAQLTPTQLTQVQGLIRDSSNRERAFTRPGITTATTTNSTQNNRLGLHDWRAARDSMAIADLTNKYNAVLKSYSDLISFINLNTLVPSPLHFDTSAGVLAPLPVQIDLTPYTNRLDILEAWKERISQITLK